jgi:ABC-type transport system involved in multi-copper enzyme maturation permease subunit
MIWLTWRQHRIEILIVGILLLMFTIILLGTGIHSSMDAHTLNTCIQNQQADCSAAQGSLSNDINQIAENPFFTTSLLALPLLTGMFIGAYAIARELEQGTYRMIWTQGLPWNRWLWRKIGLLICPVLCASGILFGLLSWWISSSNALQWGGGFSFENRFDVWGGVIIAYALFALMLGIFAGTALRRTVPAMAVTLVVFIAVRILVVNLLRPHYLPPVVLTNSLRFSTTPAPAASLVPPNSWILSNTTVDRQGRPVPPDELFNCQELLGPKANNIDQYNQCISKHGLQNRYVYQPGDRFWLFQAIESGIYLLLAALLFALTFWWIKHRIIRA